MTWKTESRCSPAHRRRSAPFDRFGFVRGSQGKSIDELLDEFAHLRAANIETLRSWRLSERELSLEGEHPALGRVTLRQLLATWVAHDLGHFAQTARVMAKGHREAVGPWRGDLPLRTRANQAEGSRTTFSEDRCVAFADFSSVS